MREDIIIKNKEGVYVYAKKPKVGVFSNLYKLKASNFTSTYWARLYGIPLADIEYALSAIDKDIVLRESYKSWESQPEAAKTRTVIFVRHRGGHDFLVVKGDYSDLNHTNLTKDICDALGASFVQVEPTASDKAILLKGLLYKRSVEHRQIYYSSFNNKEVANLHHLTSLIRNPKNKVIEVFID